MNNSIIIENYNSTTSLINNLIKNLLFLTSFLDVGDADGVELVDVVGLDEGEGEGDWDRDGDGDGDGDTEGDGGEGGGEELESWYDEARCGGEGGGESRGRGRESRGERGGERGGGEQEGRGKEGGE